MSRLTDSDRQTFRHTENRDELVARDDSVKHRKRQTDKQIYRQTDYETRSDTDTRKQRWTLKRKARRKRAPRCYERHKPEAHHHS